MPFSTDDVRIEALRPLIPPAILMEEIPLSDAGKRFVFETRRTCEEIVQGTDDRLMAVVGPCSIHDAGAAREYASLLSEARKELGGDLEILMRVYFEKPRSRSGWKGLINDPFIDGSFQINKGLRLARQLLVDLADRGIPAGCEFLDTITPQFIADCVSWGSIGARTTESQVHRELASGLSAPIGFKNGTDGNIKIAIDAIHAAKIPHRFLSVTKQGVAAIVQTKGNPMCHVILRGASHGPNCDRAHVERTAKFLVDARLPPRIMVDCSHGNSQKDPALQPVVARDVAEQVASGSTFIFGVMIEGFIKSGSQKEGPLETLEYGKSITDPCLGWDETLPVLRDLAAAARERRGRAREK
jgi:3-deoxy-7-phosphoheptulonate synthase